MYLQILLDDFKQLADRQIERGKSVQFIVEYAGQAIIDLVPEDHPHRILILEGLYAQLAKVLNRDPTVFLTSRHH